MPGKILDNVTVLDLSTFVTGGFCTLMLANQGADVVKVERPDGGDPLRAAGPPFVDGESPYFWTVNYDKRSVTLDLSTDAGREALHALAAESDVVVQNFRPGTAENLGVDYGTLREHAPDVVYCDISAFGATGPWRDRPGYDMLVQALSGIMHVTGEEGGPPVKVGLPITDLAAAMWAAFGVVGALYRRERTGEGDYVELGMLDAVLPWLTKQAGRVFAGEETERLGTRDPVLAPYRVFETAEGRLAVACLNDRVWLRLCEAIDRPDLADDERFATNADRVENADVLADELAAVFVEHTAAEWTELLAAANVPAGPVQSVRAALENEQTEARGSVGTVGEGDREVPVVEHPLRYSGADSGFDAPPPDAGEHTRAVFAEAGLDDETVADLADRGAFGADSSGEGESSDGGESSEGGESSD